MEIFWKALLHSYLHASFLIGHELITGQYVYIIRLILTMRLTMNEFAL